MTNQKIVITGAAGLVGQNLIIQLKQAGFKNLPPHLSDKCGGLIRHAAASGGTLLFPESHLDMVRVGMGLYGYFPSLETKIHLQDKIKLKPILSWKTVVVEIKEISYSDETKVEL